MGLGRARFFSLGDRHAQVVGRLHLGVLVARLMAPGHLFAQVAAHHLDTLEAEAVGHDAGRTGADDDAFDAAFAGQVAADGFQPRLAAEEFVGCRTADLELLLGQGGQGIAIDGFADGAAGTDVDGGVFVGHGATPPPLVCWR